MSTRAVIYARLSSDPKDVQRSVEEQEAECRAVCEREGWDVVRVFVDNNRGASRHSRKARPQYAALREYLTAGSADVLVMWEGSRAQREQAVFVSLRDLCADRGILYNYSGRTYDMNRTDDRFATALDAILAEREADVTRDRVLRAVRANAAKGRPHGKLLYGHRRLYDDGGVYLETVLDEDQAAIVREAARGIAAGETLYSIAQSFNYRLVAPPRAGTHWRPEQVRRMILNPGYAGKRVHQGQIVGKADWPTILDETLWAKCVQILTDPDRRTVRDNRASHLLTGAIRCAHCDSRLFTQKPPRQQKGTILTCRGRFCAAIREHLVEDFVTRVIIKRMQRPDFLKVWARMRGSEDTGAAETQAKELRTRLDGFYVLAAEGKLSPQALAAIEGRLLPQIGQADRAARPVTVPPVLVKLAGPDAEARWAGMPLAEQREAVRWLVEIRLSRAGRGVRTFDKVRLGESRWVGDSRTWAQIWAENEGELLAE